MRQQRSYSSKAVILKHSTFGEADRVLSLFTPYKGKIRVIAKGVRRPTSKKTGHLDLLCHSQLQLALGRNLDIITQAQSIENFPTLRTSLWHMTCGMYLAELVDRFVEDDTRHLDIYTLLVQSLQTLEDDAKASQQGACVSDEMHERTQLLMRYFEIHLLAAIGYEPGLRHCAHCNAELQPVENGFTPSLGGALCPNCADLWMQPLSMNGLKLLRLLQRTEWAQVPRFHLNARLHTEVESVMHSLLRFHLERDLKSWSFLEMLTVKPSLGR